MNKFIYLLVALTCIQAIHAIVLDPNNRSEDDFSKFQEEAAEFFFEFNKEHEIAHKDLAVIQGVCEKLSNAVYYFSSDSYGIDLDSNQIECEMRDFLDNFYKLHDVALKAILHLLRECDILLYMAERFSRAHNLHNNDSCSGCDTDLNKLRREIAEFFNVLNAAGAQAKADLLGLKDACSILAEQVKRFDSSHRVICDKSRAPCENRATELLIEIKAFFVEFKPPHDVAHGQLVDLANICDCLIVAIRNWIDSLDKYKCGEELLKLQEKVSEFFAEFNKEHDIAHNDLLVIQGVCIKLTNAVDYFSSDSYGTGLDSNQIECEMRDFLDNFYKLHDVALRAILHLRRQCDILLKMVDRFSNIHNLSNDDECTGCEAVTKLRRELADFFNVVKAAGVQAIADLRGLKDACSILGKQANQFDSSRRLICDKRKDPCENRANQLLIDIKTFFAKFKPPHDDAHIQLIDLSNICDSLTGAIRTWRDTLDKYRCLNDLSRLRKEAAKFFCEFENEHDEAHKYLVVVQDVCKKLSSALDAFTADNYGSGLTLNQLECELKAFLDSFFKLRDVALEAIINLLKECVKLLKMADRFSRTHNLTYNDETCTGCDAELNKLRRELAEFSNSSKAAGAQAIADLRGLKSACYILGKQAKRFNSSHRLTCDQIGAPCRGNADDVKKLLFEANAFFVDFKPPHDIAHDQLIDLSCICKHLSEILKMWKAKL